MSIASKIRSAIDEPEKLEDIYRKEPEKFKRHYGKAFSDQPDSLLFQFWRARLEYTPSSDKALSGISIMIMILLCLAAGTVLKIPDWADLKDHYYAWLVSMAPISAMFIYTMNMRGWPRRITAWGLGIASTLCMVMLLLPEKWDDVFGLACLNLPFLLWTLYGRARMNKDWQSTEARIEFPRFSGEFVIHAGLFFLGGAMLLFLTYGLFELLNISTSWVFEYPGMYGLASIPLVSAWATDTYSAARKLVPLLARIFAPLLLILILSYMGAMALNTPELLQDRSTLLIYNILLLCVLATAIFTLTGQEEYTTGRIIPRMISLMVFATLLLDIIGIWAIGWRILEFGITVNRINVLGSNLIAFGNLAVMGHGYLRYYRGAASISDISNKLARYLPVYTCWTAYAVLIQPWIFKY